MLYGKASLFLHFLLRISISFRKSKPSISFCPASYNIHVMIICKNYRTAKKWSSTAPTIIFIMFWLGKTLLSLSKGRKQGTKSLLPITGFHATAVHYLFTSIHVGLHTQLKGLKKSNNKRLNGTMSLLRASNTPIFQVRQIIFNWAPKTKRKTRL